MPKDITRVRGVHNFVHAVLLSHINDPVKLDQLFRDGLSATGNADNRGLDSDFARWTYVPTMMR